MKTARVLILVLVISLLGVEHPATAQRPSCTVRELVRTAYGEMANLRVLDNEMLYVTSASELYALSFDDDEAPRRLSSPPQSTWVAAIFDSAGEQVAFMQKEPDTQIEYVYLARLNTTEDPIRLSALNPANDPDWFWFSPDGRYLFIQYAVETNPFRGIVIVDLSLPGMPVVNTIPLQNITNMIRITNTHMIYTDIPSGFGWTERNPVFSVPLDGSRNPIRLDDGEGWVQFTVTSDRVIFVESYDGPIYSVDADKRTRPRVYDTIPPIDRPSSEVVPPRNPFQPAAGHYLFYVGYVDTIRHVIRLDLETGDIVPLTVPAPRESNGRPLNVGRLWIYGDTIVYSMADSNYEAHYYLVPAYRPATPVRLEYDTRPLAVSPNAETILQMIPSSDGVQTLHYRSLVREASFDVVTLPPQWILSTVAHFLPDGRFVYSVYSQADNMEAVYLGQCE